MVPPVPSPYWCSALAERWKRRATTSCCARWRCCRLILIGASSISAAANSSSRLKALADDLGIAARISWKGALAQEDVLEHYRRADIFALACRIAADGDRDGLPNVLVEAASQKLACVSTDISGVPELLTHEENGMVVPPEDPQALAQALERMIREPALRRRLGDAAERTRARSFRSSVEHRSVENPVRAGVAGGFVMQPRVFFYVQHLLGIGHLARASRVANALAEDGFAVLVVTGGAPVPGFPGSRITTLDLPPVTAGDAGFSGLADLRGNPVDDAFKERRRADSAAGVRNFAPDIVIIEAFPFGRRQMRFELLPLLEKVARNTPKPLLVTSVRDILQERIKPGRNEETADLVERYFDLVMVHGDPSFATIGQTFPLARTIEAKVAYTGLVAASSPGPTTEHFDILVSAGGGAAGGALVKSTVAAARMAPQTRKWCLITGPNLPEAEFEAVVADAPRQPLRLQVPPGFCQPADGCPPLGFAGRLQHRLRCASRRLPLAAHSVRSRRRDGTERLARSDLKSWDWRPF